MKSPKRIPTTSATDHQRDKFVAFQQQCVVRTSLPDTRLGLQHFVHGRAHIIHQLLAALIQLGITSG